MSEGLCCLVSLILQPVSSIKFSEINTILQHWIEILVKLFTNTSVLVLICVVVVPQNTKKL